jgi:hypothetical protein
MVCLNKTERDLDCCRGCSFVRGVVWRTVDHAVGGSTADQIAHTSRTENTAKA